MHRFELWAPSARRVQVRVNGVLHNLEGPDEHDRWGVDVEDAAPGAEYGFLLDEDPTVYPDPRSQQQPDGVHGLSRLYDHRAFVWHDEKFQAAPLSSAVIYEMHAGTFTEEGTFDAAIEHLDYLAQLGITHVELMPVSAFDGHHGWGYDGVALFAVHEPYGGPDGLKRFVNAAHQKGLAVLLDVVYNHFGPSGNYTGKFGPYVTNTHHTPWGGAVNLEGPGSFEVRRYLCDNALMWLRDFHCDGLRLDAVHAFIDRSAVHFLEQLALEVDALEAHVARNLVLIAESDLNDPRLVTPIEAGGLGMDAQWSDDFHHALLTALVPEERGGFYIDFGSLEQLAKAVEKTFVYDGAYSRYRKRNHGKSAAGLSQHHFVGFIQNHDQAGNRAKGERFAHIACMKRAKIAAAWVLMAPFVPLIFQGEEWAADTPFLYFASHEDAELAKAVSDGRKREFACFVKNPDEVPDPEALSTFLASKLNWKEQADSSHADMLAWYRSLIQLRRSTPSLNEAAPGSARVQYNEEEQWISMQRGEIILVCNLAQQQNELPLAFHAETVLASAPVVQVTERAIVLAPISVAILHKLPASEN